MADLAPLSDVNEGIFYGEYLETGIEPEVRRNYIVIWTIFSVPLCLRGVF